MIINEEEMFKLLDKVKELKKENNLLCSRLRRAAQLREPMSDHIKMLKSKIKSLEKKIDLATECLELNNIELAIETLEE